MSTLPQKETTQWPPLAYTDWKDTIATLQLWSQIVGKVRLTKMPWINHSWHVSLFVTPRGLTTRGIPYAGGLFQIDFDFISHTLLLSNSQGQTAEFALAPMTVAKFHSQLFEQLGKLGIEAHIHGAPNEIEPAIPFAKDEEHSSYDSAAVEKYWHILVNIHNVFTEFRSRFIGKNSPVHLFWGGFDLAVSRYSGRTAPKHGGGMPNMPLKIMQEAYSHEVCSAGFWLGSEQFPQPVFYAYSYPTPEEFGAQAVQPKEAFYSKEMGEFFLTYEAVSKAENPAEYLMSFLQSTYEAAANTGKWDRKALEFDFSEFKQPTTA